MGAARGRTGLNMLAGKMRIDAMTVAFGAAFIAFVLTLLSPAVLQDGDSYWHIAAGRWMIDNRAVLRIDPFSYTLAGHPWQTHEWLGEILLALAYVGGGWSGVLVLAASCYALTAWLLARALARHLGGTSLIVTLVLALGCITSSLLARPHLLALPLLAAWTAALLQARDSGRRPPLWLLPLMMLWANLHASFLFGLALLGPMALEAVMDNRDNPAKEAKAWAGYGAAALVCALTTPFGIDGLIFPFKLMAMDQLYAIAEWRPTALHWGEPLLLALGAGLFVLLSRGAKIKPLRLLVLLGLAYLALAHARHHMLLAVTGSLILAGPLAEALNNKPGPVWLRRRVQMAFAALFLMTAGLRLAVPHQRADGPATPKTALEQVPEALRHTPMLNDYAFGGYLIFNRLRPFIDGRAELYGNDFIEGYARATRPDSALLRARIAQYHIRWTILAADNRAVAAMDAMPGWRRLHADAVAVVHVKEGK